MLLCFFFFVLIIDLCLLILPVTVQTFNPTAEFAIPTGKPANEVNAETETQPPTGERKVRTHSK